MNGIANSNGVTKETVQKPDIYVLSHSLEVPINPFYYTVKICVKRSLSKRPKTGF